MKIILQSIFTLIILLIGIWLFMLIPTPSSLMNGTSLAGIFLYPLAIAFYISMVSILGVSVWNFIAFIFKENQHKEDNIVLDTSTNKKYNYQLNQKQQIQDLNTAVKHTDSTGKMTVANIENKNTSLIFTTFRIGSWIVGISFSLALSLLAYFIYFLGSSNHSDEVKTYHVVYEVEDYNDSRIINYNQALENASKELIHSENMYDIFKTNTKREIALECIRNFRKEHNATKQSQADVQIKHFKLNARNSYAKTENIIEESIKKEKYLRKNSWKYSYPGSANYGFTYLTVGLQESCKQEISVDKIFKDFMPFYVKGQVSKLNDLRIRAITSSSTKKYFVAQKKWVEVLHKKYLKY